MTQPCCNRVLVNVTKKGDELTHIIHRLTLESILKKMAVMLIPFVIVPCICGSDAFHNRRQRLCLFPQEKMHMVWHKAICID